ncbi:hypothetical protein PVAP13_5NG133681 [Panicum virgatum]|uniref:Uncharacterized protein n=1 Tax=Panicum virgatum TaxID=38727 RepID=A0A8T0RM10_PANVG|nr:hypothetical protein PVAP13_5NG133681 [Panicum virgatum]
MRRPGRPPRPGAAALLQHCAQRGGVLMRVLVGETKPQRHGRRVYGVDGFRPYPASVRSSLMTND